MAGEAPPTGNGLFDDDEEVKEPTTTTYGDDPRSLDDDLDWKTRFRSDAITAVEKWADDLGLDRFSLDSYVRSNIDGAVNYIMRTVTMPNRQSRTYVDPESGAMKQVPGGNWVPRSATDWQQIWDAGLAYFSFGLGIDLTKTRGGSGSSGSRGLSAQDIRNSFDEDELTDAAQKIWQAYMWEDTVDARKMARDYINTIVGSLGQKEVDFETFIRSRAEATPRWNALYRNKPSGMDPKAYVGQYAQAALSVVGGSAGREQELSNLVGGGAGLGATPDAFRNRLARTDANRNSTGFVTGLEDRLRSVKGILRG